MALPFRYNIDAYLDRRIGRSFLWQAGGTPKDLTGWTGRLQIGRTAATVQQVNGALTLGGTAGTIVLSIPAGTLTTPGTYRYVIDVTAPNSQPDALVIGKLRMLAVFP